MLLPRSLFPADEKDWHGFLREYFCDKDATTVTEGSHVQIRLAWPSDAKRHVDPQLRHGLAWWGGGVTEATMWSARHREGRILTALYDSWTLHSWSEWLERHPGARNSDIVILHADDHRDLGAPRLLFRGDELVDAITRDYFDIFDPASVHSAIRSGAVGMGSFMTPFIHAFPNVRVRHLCQPPKLKETLHLRMFPKRVPDHLLGVGSERPAVGISLGDIKESCGYIATSDAGVWCKGIENCLALVHIDMDYFNNRYDGDSDWREREQILDAGLPEILSKIDTLVDSLAQSRARIEDVSIAYSPGFFPAEFWSVADRRLRSGLRNLL